MEKFAKLIVIGGLTAVGVAVAGYRAYKLKKRQEEIQQEVIDITVESIDSSNKNA